MSATPQFEIPTDLRKMAEQSLEHVRAAIHGYLQFCQRAAPADAVGGSELSNKIFGYAERNVESAFEFAQRLVQVRDAQEITKLQAVQVKDLSETATKALTERVTPLKGGLSS